MSFAYNIAIYLYLFIIYISGIFNKKAKQWIFGRKKLFEKIRTTIDPHEKIAWFHCASLGEFEQGRPIIEGYRQEHPEYKILLTFFSPSGYEIRKNYKGADYIFYLPIDTKSNARKFISLVKPDLVFFIKYEFWFNYINILHQKKIPVFIVSAIFRPDQYFFKWYGWWFRKMLNKISYIFVQNPDSLKLLNSIGITHTSVSGDTRFDRVFAVAQQKKSFPIIEQFKENKNIFLSGSTWPSDENLIFTLIEKNFTNLKFIIAPHETNIERINLLLKKINRKAIKYSEAKADNIKNADVLIIDSIGILSHLYQYSAIAYIGGGFGKGIHNILEAATFGKPVIFGTNYHKFQEAKDLIKSEGAFSINNSNELINKSKELLNNSDFYKKCSETCINYINEKKGATGIILKNIIFSKKQEKIKSEQ
ncbi:MAG: 3-deoxy-D-manno-octulosonic acid transferase [Bacteroidales bacterium]|nr:3-deoxy-D-manno-octulosonic acid transferase [Bacteroidales bacterium]